MLFVRMYDTFMCTAGSRAAAPAHMNSAASAKEAIRAMEAEKQERLDREGGEGGGGASLRSSSRDREARPRERSERGRSVTWLDSGILSCVLCIIHLLVCRRTYAVHRCELQSPIIPKGVNFP